MSNSGELHLSVIIKGVRRSASLCIVSEKQVGALPVAVRRGTRMNVLRRSI